MSCVGRIAQWASQNSIVPSDLVFLSGLEDFQGFWTIWWYDLTRLLRGPGRSVRCNLASSSSVHGGLSGQLGAQCVLWVRAICWAQPNQTHWRYLLKVLKANERRKSIRCTMISIQKMAKPQMWICHRSVHVELRKRISREVYTRKRISREMYTRKCTNCTRVNISSEKCTHGVA